MTDIYLFRHMFSLTSLGEGSEKRPTVTKHKMNGSRPGVKHSLCVKCGMIGGSRRAQVQIRICYVQWSNMCIACVED
jgi:hypothetical protein